LKQANVIFNLICSSLVVLLPFILYYNAGTIETSVSAYHNTSAKYILLFSLLLVSISYWLNENIGSSILLLGVAAFNMEDFAIIHYTFAVTFFLYTTYNIVKDKRFRYLGYPVIVATFLIPYITFFWFEVIAITSFAVHGVLYSFKKLKVLKVRNKKD
jgi:hypothetical protein